MSQKGSFFKNNIPSSESDEGAKGYGIVVFKLFRRFHILAGIFFSNPKPAGTMEYRNECKF